MITFISKLISKIRNYIRDLNNIDNYLSWGLECERLEFYNILERYS